MQGCSKFPRVISRCRPREHSREVCPEQSEGSLSPDIRIKERKIQRELSLVFRSFVSSPVRFAATSASAHRPLVSFSVLCGEASSALTNFPANTSMTRIPGSPLPALGLSSLTHLLPPPRRPGYWRCSPAPRLRP